MDDYIRIIIFVLYKYRIIEFSINLKNNASGSLFNVPVKMYYKISSCVFVRYLALWKRGDFYMLGI